MIDLMSMQLYYLEQCPYSQKVLNYTQEHHISIDTRDISNPKFKAELIEVGGKSQVPCLVHDGEALYESNDIIAFLAKQVREKE